MFAAALAARGRPAPQVVAWCDLLDEPARLGEIPDEPSHLRIDSFGENHAVDQRLWARGFSRAVAEGVQTIAPDRARSLVADRGRILAPRQLHLGFLDALDDLRPILTAHPSWRVKPSPDSIAALFDKRVTSRLYEAAGVPVPERLDGIQSRTELRAKMAERDWPAVFVKLASGSSAAGLAVYHQRGPSEYLVAPIELAAPDELGTRLYSTLRIHRYDDARRIDEILAFLLGEGAIIERAIPKARLDGRLFDLRVLVVAGEPAFVVARTSTHPITNLHLGGRRGDLSLLDEECPRDAWSAAMDSCRRVFAAHDCLHVGVDLLFEPRYRGHRVVEANAFGDLLPNLTRDGLSVYEYEIEAIS
jgi:glutathione synthase/RimK-type ligase-like ATP-grasp enzyme